MKSRTEYQAELAEQYRVALLDSPKLTALAYDIIEAMASDWQTETRYFVGGLTMALRLLLERDKKERK